MTVPSVQQNYLFLFEHPVWTGMEGQSVVLFLNKISKYVFFYKTAQKTIREKTIAKISEIFRAGALYADQRRYRISKVFKQANCSSLLNNSSRNSVQEDMVLPP